MVTHTFTPVRTLSIETGSALPLIVLTGYPRVIQGMGQSYSGQLCQFLLINASHLLLRDVVILILSHPPLTLAVSGRGGAEGGGTLPIVIAPIIVDAEG